MPAAVTETPTKPDRSEQMWKVLKAHIMRERARKKQEREAEVEEERLRKEREAREQQDVMTLGETREQISQLETKLQQLKDEKHQLFLQLKKVLNEDDNRRRQLVKESTEMMAAQAQQAGGAQLVHPNLYIVPGFPKSSPMVLHPPGAGFKSTTKRPRSPSPQPAPVSTYHQGYAYKQPVPAATYQNSPQKTPQYPTQPGAFYSVQPQDLPIYYPIGSSGAAASSSAGAATRDVTRTIYEPPPTRPQAYHLEPKLAAEHYALRAPPSHTHVIHGGATIPINPAPPPSKAGSITAGYPVRSQQQQQQQYQQSAPASLYTTQSRNLYQSPGTPINYPPRE